MSRKPRKLDEPTMSDRTILMNVEDLIITAFGAVQGNTVDLKMVQTILHILARELRLLEQDVEIKIAEDQDKMTELKDDFNQYDLDETESETSDDDEDGGTKKVAGKAGKDGKTADKAERKGEKIDGKLKKDERKEEKGEKKVAKSDKVGKGDKGDKGEKGDKIEKAKQEKGEKIKGQVIDDEKQAGKRDKKTGKDKLDKDEKTSDKDEKRSGKGRDQAGLKGKSNYEEGTDAEGKRGDDEKHKTKQKEGKETSEEDETLKGKQSKRGVDKGIGISVSEEVRKGKQGDKEKILVVEKGPTTRDSRTRVGSIEVVTRSEFNLLESKVSELSSIKGPLPMPTMPDNKELKSALVKGTATLPDTMEAMQVNARVQAAEQALTCMADLLTQLAAAGAIPPELGEKVNRMTTEVQELSYAAQAAAQGLDTAMAGKRAVGARKSVALDPVAHWDTGETSVGTGAVSGTTLATKSSSPVSSKMSTPSISTKNVTQNEMEAALLLMKNDLLNKMSSMTTKTTGAAEQASSMAKSVADKMEIAVNLNNRINDLFALTRDYAEQLTGFDAGLVTQMQSFHEQMMQMRSDLQGGLTQLNAVNNNAETVAVAELRTAYDTLVVELETTLHMHTSLVTMQKQLGEELTALIHWVELLREQKADRDEVTDGLRDKADLTRLQGLLNNDAFEETRKDLEIRLDLCHEKFDKQDLVWMRVLKDLTNIADSKAQLMQLMSLRDSATEQLRTMQETMLKLEIMLGEPQAALVMRQLSLGAQCGSCRVPALIPPLDANYGSPAPLPALKLRAQRPEELEPCTTELQILAPTDTREHICNRWVGGSHTLMSEHVTRDRAPPLEIGRVPTKRYTDYGSDGRLYMFEVELQPCSECNQIAEEKPIDAPPPSAVGDGDHKPTRDNKLTTVCVGDNNNCTCECCKTAKCVDYN